MSIEEQKRFLKAFAEAERLKVRKSTLSFFTRDSMPNKGKPEEEERKNKEPENC
jgi:hypothetical protein